MLELLRSARGPCLQQLVGYAYAPALNWEVESEGLLLTAILIQGLQDTTRKSLTLKSNRTSLLSSLQRFVVACRF